MMNRGNMSGPTPLQPQQYYHIFNRGINGENIFREERNYQYFLDLYAKHINPVADTFSYCLLKNHFHLLVRIRSNDATVGEQNTREISTTNSSVAFSNFFNAYAKGFNKTYSRTGSLFEHTFRRVLVTDDAQYTATIRYIHKNPQKHGFVDDFRAWPYSSYGSLTNDRITWLNRGEVLSWFGGSEGLKRDHLIMNELFNRNDGIDFD
jgi:putative transposase